MSVDVCLFCLEEDKPNNPVILLDFALEKECSCTCRIYIHVPCWLYYFRTKNGFECPICHSHNDNEQQVITETPVPVDNPLQILIVNEVHPLRVHISPYVYFFIVFMFFFLAVLIYRVFLHG
jgi:hypothetical protein